MYSHFNLYQIQGISLMLRSSVHLELSFVQGKGGGSCLFSIELSSLLPFAEAAVFSPMCIVDFFSQNHVHYCPFHND